MALENQVTFAEVGNPKRVTQLTENTDAAGAYFLTEKVGETAAKKTSYATVESAIKSKVQSEYLQALSATPASDKTMSEKLVVGELKKRDDKIVQLEQESISGYSYPSKINSTTTLLKLGDCVDITIATSIDFLRTANMTETIITLDSDQLLIKCKDSGRVYIYTDGLEIDTHSYISEKITFSIAVKEMAVDFFINNVLLHSKTADWNEKKMNIKFGGLKTSGSCIFDYKISYGKHFPFLFKEKRDSNFFDIVSDISVNDTYVVKSEIKLPQTCTIAISFKFDDFLFPDIIGKKSEQEIITLVSTQGGRVLRLQTDISGNYRINGEIINNLAIQNKITTIYIVISDKISIINNGVELHSIGYIPKLEDTLTLYSGKFYYEYPTFMKIHTLRITDGIGFSVLDNEQNNPCLSALTPCDYMSNIDKCFINALTPRRKASALGVIYSYSRNIDKEQGGVMSLSGDTAGIIEISAGINKEVEINKETNIVKLKSKNGSSISYNSDGYNRDDEYIHPSVAYSPVAIGGYKYWCFASNYPATNPRYEDEDLLCSVDGVDWSRVVPFAESQGGALSLPPKPSWITTDRGRENSFVPIPPSGSVINLNGSSYTVVVSLKHDPFLLIKNGELFCYCFYNFFSSTQQISGHRFVVVFSTSDVKNWYINRSDGSKIPASIENINEIFTQSSVDGKNNYIRYFNEYSTTNNGVLKNDTAMQIINDGKNYYAYYGEYHNYNNSNIGVKRYKGVSHLDFNWDECEYCNSTTSVEKTTHWGYMFSDGKFYIIGKNILLESLDGISFDAMPYNPIPILPFEGYEVSTCIDDGGFIVAIGGYLTESARKFSGNSIRGAQMCGTIIIKYKNINEFIDVAKNGSDEVKIIAVISNPTATSSGSVDIIDIKSVVTSEMPKLSIKTQQGLIDIKLFATFKEKCNSNNSVFFAFDQN